MQFRLFDGSEALLQGGGRNQNRQYLPNPESNVPMTQPSAGQSVLKHQFREFCLFAQGFACIAAARNRFQGEVKINQLSV